MELKKMSAIMVDTRFVQRVEYIYISQIPPTPCTFLIFYIYIFFPIAWCFSSIYLRMCIKHEEQQKLSDADFVYKIKTLLLASHSARKGPHQT